MLTIFTPETGDADVPITVFPIFFGPGQMSSSVLIGQNQIREYEGLMFVSDWTILLFHLDMDEPQISPKKGIGSGSVNSSGGHFARFLTFHSSSYVSSNGSSITGSSMSGTSCSANRSSRSFIIC